MNNTIKLINAALDAGKTESEVNELHREILDSAQAASSKQLKESEETKELDVLSRQPAGVANETGELDKVNYDYSEYVKLGSENIFRGTTFESYVTNGRIPSGNHDIQAFASGFIDASGPVFYDTHGEDDLIVLQYFALRECCIAKEEGNYLDNLRKFPSIKGDYTNEIAKVKTMLMTAEQRDVYPIKLVGTAVASKTIFFEGKYVVIIVPNNIGFINGVINLVRKNSTDVMKSIQLVCKMIRQGRAPLPALLKQIKEYSEDEDKGFQYHVIVNDERRNETSMRIMSAILNQDVSEICKEMRQKNSVDRK